MWSCLPSALSPHIVPTAFSIFASCITAARDEYKGAGEFGFLVSRIRQFLRYLYQDPFSYQRIKSIFTDRLKVCLDLKMTNNKCRWLIGALVLVCSAQACVLHSGKRMAGPRSPTTANLKRRQIPPPATGVVTLTNVSVFDGASISGPSTVIISGRVIGAVIPIGDVPSGVDKVINGEGGVLLPGLIDSHCHPESIDNLEQLTSYGVTTAFNMACMNYTVCDILRSPQGLTSIITTGFIAVAPGSPHAKLLDIPPQDTISSPDQAAQFVANVFGNHSDFFKMVAEPGGPSQETLNALVQYTHQAGHISATHAAYIENYDQAITSLTDSIQHVPVDMPATEAMAQRIHQQNQYVTPTLNAFKILLSLPEGIALSLPGSNYSNAQKSAQILYKAGVKTLAGTDSYVNEEIGLIISFGIGLHDELGYLVDAGLTPLEALNAATSLPARLHSLPDRGAIAPGLRADLLLISGNPLINISNTKNIMRVWTAGIEYNGVLG
jgi:imidazolonepropionase-like amidohydrolase